MATNLVSEIAEVLSPNIVSSIASALGLNRTATQKAVVAAVPALLIRTSEPTLARKSQLLADTFASIRPNLDQLLDKALAIPGVATLLKPAVDAIRSKLDALSTA